VQGKHTYYLPVLPDRGPNGRGRAQTWNWPASAIEVPPEEIKSLKLDAIIFQRPEEYEDLSPRWFVRKQNARMFYVEHNCPQGRINEMRHPAADDATVTVVHVTHLNDLFWDCGSARTAVIEHGVVDPGYRYTGELPRGAIVVNEPVRRARVTGTDLIARFAEIAPIDLFGMQIAALRSERANVYENLRQAELHEQLPRRRAYIHPLRWTSLGLSLIEAMHLGMPVVALAATEAVHAVPRGAGFIDTDVRALQDAFAQLIAQPELAREMGKRARDAALARYSLQRFLDDWDALLGS